MTNVEVASLLRNIAAAYEILGENRFKIIAYSRAADSIEHLASEIKDVWDDGKIGEIPGVGTTIAKHLTELFEKGRVRHFTDVMSKVPASVFPLLLVPGIGPKKAFKLVTGLGLTDANHVVDDLAKAAQEHKIAVIESFGDKSEQDILQAVASYKKGAIKERRMNLPEADAIASRLVEYLRKHKSVLRVDSLGSLRRQVSTIGDVDISVATRKPQEVLEYFLLYPHEKLIEKGPVGASILLSSGRQVDLRVQHPDLYGAMLQYFTGSKHHNIKLRSYALTKGLSLNEYGITHVKDGRVEKIQTEKAFYGRLGLPYIPPELREDAGEIEAAEENTLPQLVETRDIQGDVHIHTSYNLEPSHDLGANSIEENFIKAEKIGYSYIGFSDHNPSISQHTKTQIISIMKRRKEFYDQHYYSYIHSKTKSSTLSTQRIKMFIMCEVDIQPNGALALPVESFAYVDAVIVSVHSSFGLDKEVMTNRVIQALTFHPKVRILGHPTGRLLGKREGFELDWERVFACAREKNIALEINAYPDRLDLPDVLVRDAVKKDVPLIINTDAHALDHMDLMPYGVSVARRGWAEKDDIVNTREYNTFAAWLSKGG